MAKQHPPQQIFHASFAAIAQLGSALDVQQFITDLLGPVIAAILEKATDFPSLHKGMLIFEDETRKILERIRADEGNPNVALKRRHSPPKEHVRPLLRPQSPKQDVKRRKSFHAGENGRELLPPTNFMRRNSFNGGAASSNAKETRRGSDTGEESAEAPVPVASILGLSVGVASQDSFHQDVATEGTEEDGGKDNAPPPVSQTVAGVNPGKIAVNLTTYIQNKIMATEFTSDPFKDIPILSIPMWNILLGDVDTRNPLETCGDAAMQVVMSEIVIEKANELQEVKDRKAVKSSLIGPLLSNATFLHLVSQRSYFIGHTLPKYPGNAWEVYAGALARDASLSALKSVVEVAFEPLIAAALDARSEYEWISELLEPEDDRIKRINDSKRRIRLVRQRHPDDYSSGAEVSSSRLRSKFKFTTGDLDPSKYLEGNGEEAGTSRRRPFASIVNDPEPEAFPGTGKTFPSIVFSFTAPPLEKPVIVKDLPLPPLLPPPEGEGGKKKPLRFDPFQLCTWS
ncbi:hypothetical protein DFH09DRAFT_1318899 [Mycena vulgaris]|nr:hypothetical protein DFH09DRAFT_1318899 [Mycena vulgaris]